MPRKLEPFGVSLSTFGLPLPQNTNGYITLTLDYHNESEKTNNAAPLDTNTRIGELLRGLNNQQSVCVLDVLEGFLRETGKCFYMFGPGGSGKTHIYRILFQMADLQNILTVNVPSTGIAATPVSKDSTAHSRFKILLQLS
jgi:chromosomal replication initiation ATPase DnaA